MTGRCTGRAGSARLRWWLRGCALASGIGSYATRFPIYLALAILIECSGTFSCNTDPEPAQIIETVLIVETETLEECNRALDVVVLAHLYGWRQWSPHNAVLRCDGSP